MHKKDAKAIIWRIVLPLVIVFVWLGASGLGGPYFGRISEVSSNDMSTFLPASAESTQVNNDLAKFRDSRTIPVVVVFASSHTLTAQQFGQVKTVSSAIDKTGQVVGSISPAVVSDDKKAVFLVVPLSSSSQFDKVIPQLQTAVANTKPSLEYKFTGPAMFAQDLNKAFSGIDGVLLLVALAVVFIILFIVYRSPFLPIITLLGAMFSLSAAILVVWNLAKAGVVQLNGQVQGILFILVIGAATDYALLYIARYREELTRNVDKWQATKAAWKASWEPIVAAGSTVSLGLMCLLVSDLSSNKALGPVGGVGIVFAILSSLTFLPAVLLLFGKKAFWPREPKANSLKVDNYHLNHPTWAKVGRLVGRHPRRLWVGLVALLVVAALFMPQLKADGVAQSDFVLGKSEARDGQALLDQHFPAGSGSPAYVVTPQKDMVAVTKLLKADSGVDAVTPIVEYTAKGPAPKVVDGTVVLQATLKDPADSVPARQTIERLRKDVQSNYTSVKIGGVSAVQLDVNNAAQHDLKLIIPLILVVITIILMLLLRSIVAPLVLLLTTVLSFGATLGIAALAFNHLWQYPGADPSVVIFGFVFLVALGIDYNIFLMTRIREETIKNGVRNGTIKALVVTGGVISSAGIVLASTFAALYVIPILFLAQIAFIVAFGVLLDTLIVRSLIAPSLTLEIGRWMWWPSKLSRNKK